jgi:hypothetical protein
MCVEFRKYFSEKVKPVSKYAAFRIRNYTFHADMHGFTVSDNNKKTRSS